MPPGNTIGLQNTIRDLEREKTMLIDRLAHQDRDVEALRARLAAIGTGNVEGQQGTQQRVSELSVENEKLRRQLDTMKLKYGDANALQLKLKEYDDKIRTLLQENDKLNLVLNEKMRELQNLKNSVVISESPSTFKEVNVMRPGLGEAHKATGANIPGQGPLPGQSPLPGQQQQQQSQFIQPQRQSQVQPQSQSEALRMHSLMRKNEELANENERLNMAVRQLQEDMNQNPEQLRGRLELILRENERLNQLLGDKVKEVEDLKSQLKTLPGGNVKIEQLNQQIGGLLGDNRRLTEAVNEKSREIEVLRKRLGEFSSGPSNLEKLEEKIILVTGENERLNRLLEERNREVEVLRRQIEDLRGGNLKVQELSLQVNALQDENRRLALLKADNDSA